MNRRIVHRLIAAFMAFLFIMLIAPVYSTAQSTGLKINPRTDMVIEAGETQSANLLVSNLNKNVPITVSLSIVDFKSTNETGTPTPILEENAEPTPWSLKPFITIPETVELAKGESKYVPYTISIPKGQGAGSYYSAIYYEPKPAESESNVVISGSPMQLVFVTVPGKATELMVLKEFGAYVDSSDNQSGKYVSIFTNSQPKKLAYLLENRGNVAEGPTGSIIIKNMFGKTVREIPNANPKNNLALIGQTRQFEVCIESRETKVEQDGSTATVEECIDPGLAPGMYTANMKLLYGINGNTNQEIDANAVFWYLPYWFIGVILGILAIVAYIIYRIRNKLIGAKSHRRQR